MIALLTNPEQSRHQAEGHPERPQRVTAILEAIAVSDLGVTAEPAAPVADSLIEQVHDPGYVAMLDRAAASGGGYLDADTYITPDSMTAARTAAGAVVAGVEAVLDGRVRHALAVVPRHPLGRPQTERVTGSADRTRLAQGRGSGRCPASAATQVAQTWRGCAGQPGAVAEPHTNSMPNRNDSPAA